MNLEKDKILTRSELADFFGVKPQTITKAKEKYLEDLKDYCDYELLETKTGKFKGVKILYVHCDTYYKSYKKDFLDWLENNDVFALTGEDGLSNIAVVTNHYCHLNGIPYEGPHYILEDFEGRTNDGKRAMKERQKIPNYEFKQWHYLYRLARQFFSGNGEFHTKEYELMCSNVFQPIYLNKMTEEKRQKYNQIVFEIYGNQTENFVETTQSIEEIDTKDMSADEMRKEILSLRSMRDMTDQEKRQKFIMRLAEEGVIKFKGYMRRPR